MFFIGINTLEVIILDNTENWKDKIVECKLGLIEGMGIGGFIAIFALVILNLSYFLLAEYAIRITIIAWITFAIIATALYGPLFQKPYKSFAFLTGLIGIIGIMNYIYMDLPSNCLYGSLEIFQVVAFVVLGIAIGILIRIAEKKSRSRI